MKLWPYFLRCKESDFPELVALGVLLGVIREVEMDGPDVDRDDEGFPIDPNPPVKTEIIGANGCDWDLVFGTGKLYEGTGVFTEVNGIPIEESHLIVDEMGHPYIHINILTRFDLGDRAREMAVNHPELAEALSNMGKYFLLDGEGKVRRPANPQCSYGVLEPV